jgi:NAD(P)-dependent dehydrogenase (short-subunit alcohol dehydrogenase family)
MWLERQAKNLGGSGEEAAQKAVKNRPLGRLVEPKDIVNLILFLVPERTSAITGQVIAVDGGAGGGIAYKSVGSPPSGSAME